MNSHVQWKQPGSKVSHAGLPWGIHIASTTVNERNWLAACIPHLLSLPPPSLPPNIIVNLSVAVYTVKGWPMFLVKEMAKLKFSHSPLALHSVADASEKERSLWGASTVTKMSPFCCTACLCLIVHVCVFTKILRISEIIRLLYGNIICRRQWS